MSEFFHHERCAHTPIQQKDFSDSRVVAEGDGGEKKKETHLLKEWLASIPEFTTLDRVSLSRSK